MCCFIHSFVLLFYYASYLYPSFFFIFEALVISSFFHIAILDSMVVQTVQLT